MTTARLADLRSRLYDTYASQLIRVLQAEGFDAEGIDISPEQAALARAAGVPRVHQRDFRAILAAHPTRVMVWQMVSACYRVALATGAGMLRGHIVAQNLMFAASAWSLNTPGARCGQASATATSLASRLRRTCSSGHPDEERLRRRRRGFRPCPA